MDGRGPEARGRGEPSRGTGAPRTNETGMNGTRPGEPRAAESRQGMNGIWTAALALWLGTAGAEAEAGLTGKGADLLIRPPAQESTVPCGLPDARPISSESSASSPESPDMPKDPA
jgi:hypothetical protein